MALGYGCGCTYYSSPHYGATYYGRSSTRALTMTLLTIALLALLTMTLLTMAGRVREHAGGAGRGRDRKGGREQRAAAAARAPHHDGA